MDGKHLIGICGPPSSRKTTTANRMYGWTTGSRQAVPEYAREWIMNHGRISGVAGQQKMMYGQLQRETQALEVYQWVISDSPQFLSFVYATLGGTFDIRDSEHRAILAEIYEHAIHSLTKYSRIYLLAAKPVIDDGIRVQSDDEARVIFDRIHQFLELHIPGQYVLLDIQDNNERTAIIIGDMISKGILTREDCTDEGLDVLRSFSVID